MARYPRSPPLYRLPDLRTFQQFRPSSPWLDKPTTDPRSPGKGKLVGQNRPTLDWLRPSLTKEIGCVLWLTIPVSGSFAMTSGGESRAEWNRAFTGCVVFLGVDIFSSLLSVQYRRRSGRVCPSGTVSLLYRGYASGDYSERRQ